MLLTQEQAGKFLEFCKSSNDLWELCYDEKKDYENSLVLPLKDNAYIDVEKEDGKPYYVRYFDGDDVMLFEFSVNDRGATNNITELYKFLESKFKDLIKEDKEMQIEAFETFIKENL